MFGDPQYAVRDEAFCVAPTRKGFLLREDRYAYIQYGEDASGGMELFDMLHDPKQNTNLASRPDFSKTVERLKTRMVAKLNEVRRNDLPPKDKVSAQ